MIPEELKKININTVDYINTEIKIINRFKKINAINILEWVDKYAIKYHNAVMKLKKLDIILLENEIYRGD